MTPPMNEELSTLVQTLKQSLEAADDAAWRVFPGGMQAGLAFKAAVSQAAEKLVPKTEADGDPEPESKDGILARFSRPGLTALIGLLWRQHLLDSKMWQGYSEGKDSTSVAGATTSSDSVSGERTDLSRTVHDELQRLEGNRNEGAELLQLSDRLRHQLFARKGAEAPASAPRHTFSLGEWNTEQTAVDAHVHNSCLSNERVG